MQKKMQFVNRQLAGKKIETIMLMNETPATRTGVCVASLKLDF
jgi:hypothetical protein